MPENILFETEPDENLVELVEAKDIIIDEERQNINELNCKVDTVLEKIKRVYYINHGIKNCVSLEAEYERIRYDYDITADTEIDEDKTYYIKNEDGDEKDFTSVAEPDISELSNYYERFLNGTDSLSAVGFTALLKNGDTIPVIGRTFINGEEETADYTFTGENGIEFVNVWYFEDGGSLNLSEAVDLLITEVDIRAKQTVPTISSTYYDFVQKIKTDNFTISTIPLSCKELAENGVYARISASASSNLKKYSSDVVQIKKNLTGLANNSSIEFLDFPELIYLGFENLNNVNSTAESGANAEGKCFFGMTNPNLTFNFPKLQYIRGGSIGNYCIFNSVQNVEIPASVKRINLVIARNNKTVKLLCKNAEYISDDWCVSTPTSLFYMCPDWGASINIATAAANWVKDDFIDLFTNKLRDMEDDVREIKIPTAIYDSLTDEEFALAEDKGWTVGC